ncbi:MAG: MFS transporter [Chitinivibrionales bacterium]
MIKVHYDANVILTGCTSFFTDVSSEMIYPLLQAFVTMIMASQKVLLGPVLGIIEGISESTASLLKVFSGYYSDRTAQRKAPTIGGYALSAIAKLLLFAASSGWYFVLLSRFFDRVGKGVRGAPRDALIAESTPKEEQGRAFGFQRSMDFAGAFCGVAICYFLTRRFIGPAANNLKTFGDFYWIFFISVVPAFIGVIFLFFLKEKIVLETPKESKPRPSLDFRKYDRNLRLFFLVQCFFTLGNSSNQFLLLRSMNLGFSLSMVILMYMLFNLASTMFGTAFGKVSDKKGRKLVLVSGYGLYCIVYGAFGFITTQTNWLLWGVWTLYGLFYALTEGIEKAFIAGLAPPASKATALGFSYTIVGIGLLPASVIAGLLYSVSPAAPFVFGALMSCLAFFVMIIFVKERPGGKNLGLT